MNLKSVRYHADVIIAGGGIAGLITAYKLLDQNKSVIILDKNTAEHLGGLALEAAGGVHMIGTPEQRRAKIKDSPEIALSDWLRVAQFTDNAIHAKKWAEFYCTHSYDYIYQFLHSIGVTFLPLPLWVERGTFITGNTFPRWHLMWGTGWGTIQKLIAKINEHPNRIKLQIYFEHDVTGIEQSTNNAIFHGRILHNQQSFQATGDNIIIASGGIGGGDLSTIRQYWPTDAPPLPEHLLNGAHIFGDGQLHHCVKKLGARLTNMASNWLYPSSVPHPDKRKYHDGIALSPAAHSLWINALGQRIQNPPMLVGYCMKDLVYKILTEPGQFSWSITNYKIATKELIVQLSRYWSAVREENKLKLIRNVLLGDQYRIDTLIKDAPEHVLVANNLDDLLEQMQKKNLYGYQLDKQNIERELLLFDQQIQLDKKWHSDDQLRRIDSMSQYRGDKMRLAQKQPINDPKAYPLMAILQFPITRKSLGGIETDLNCRVVTEQGSSMQHVFAIGEAAGYGGGGICGQCSLEGTFLGGCILTALKCAESLK